MNIIRHRGRRAAAVGVLTLVMWAQLAGSRAVAVPVVSQGVTCATAAPAVSEGGVEMSATVIGPDTDPCAPSPAGSGSGAGTPGSATKPSGPRASGAAVAPTVETAVETSTETPAPGDDETDLGGILNVGGLSSSYLPSLNPLGGELSLSFTVRNVSKTTIDASADFWIDGPFGIRLGSIDDVAISSLKPGESQVVTADVPGVGQWTVLNAHMTFHPPESVEGTELSPLTRDTLAFALPWFLLLLVAVALAGWVVVQVVRRREPVSSVEPIGVPT